MINTSRVGARRWPRRRLGLTPHAWGNAAAGTVALRVLRARSLFHQLVVRIVGIGAGRTGRWTVPTVPVSRTERSGVPETRTATPHGHGMGVGSGRPRRLHFRGGLDSRRNRLWSRRGAWALAVHTPMVTVVPTAEFVAVTRHGHHLPADHELAALRRTQDLAAGGVGRLRHPLGQRG